MKSFFGKMAIITVSLLLTFFLFEGIVRGYYFFTRGPKHSYKDLLKETKFLEYAGILGNEGCDWLESLYPHPFLGYIQHDLEPCGWNLNSEGMFGRDFSDDPEVFQVLFLGGSVAQQISSGFNGMPYSWIEEALNKSFHPPKGKRFHIINAALGGWKQPNQIYQLMRNMHKVDAFISLEGYNEMNVIQRPRKMDQPAFPHFLTTSYPDTISPFEMISSIRDFIGSSPLKFSYVAILIFRNMKSLIVTKTLRDLESSHVNNYFIFPPHMSEDEQVEKGIIQYLSYLKSMDGIASAGNKKGIIFLQPIPNLFKPLHPKDWPPRQGLSPLLYLDLEKRISQLKLKQTPMVPLLRIYKEVNDFIYVDDIHAHVDHTNGRSLGYEIMAREIAQETGQMWKLKPRK